MTDDPNSLVPVTTSATEFEASVIVAKLEDEGIPARRFDGLSYVGSAAVVGFRPEISVMVRQADLARARAALDAARADSVDIDWNEVDVGQPEPAGPLSVSPDRLPRALRNLAVVVFGVALLALLTLIGGRIAGLF